MVFFFRCEDYGGVLKIPGDNERDAVCGNFKSGKFLALSVFEILLKKREMELSADALMPSDSLSSC